MMDRLLENKTALKILAVIVAVFIWVQSIPRSTPKPLLVPNVPVVFSSIGSNLTVVSVSPKTVQVKIEGPPNIVNSSAITTDVSASIVSRITHPGTSTMKVSASVPPQVTVLSVSPKTVTVVVAKTGQKRVPINVYTTGSVNPGDELSGYKSETKEALISGPVAALSQVKSVVGTLNVSGKSNSFNTSVVLRPVNGAGHVVPKVQVNPASTTVKATIKPKPPEKVLPVIGKITGKPATGYSVASISVYPSSVTISGTKSVLASISNIAAVPVNVSGAKSTITKKVSVVVPKGATLVSSGQVTVTVTISGAG